MPSASTLMSSCPGLGFLGRVEREPEGGPEAAGFGLPSLVGMQIVCCLCVKLSASTPQS